MEFGADFVGEDLVYKNYTHLSPDEAKQVLLYRNDENVRKWMSNDSMISLENHLAYIQYLRTSTDKCYWAVFRNGFLIGGVSVVNIKNNMACSGIFLNPSYIGSGIGLKVSYYFNEHLFGTLGLESTYSEINKENHNAIKLNKYMGALISDKEGLFVDVSITSAAWEINKTKVKRLISFV